MKIKLLVAAYCFFGTVVATPAQVGGIKVQVPFEFHFAKQTLPAGEYVIWSERDQLFLRIAGGKTVAMVQSNRTVHDGGKTGKVLFNCYAGTAFFPSYGRPTRIKLARFRDPSRRWSLPNKGKLNNLRYWENL
jgi:hypothetical protein